MLHRSVSPGRPAESMPVAWGSGVMTVVAVVLAVMAASRATVHAAPAPAEAVAQARQLIQQGKYADAEAQARALLAEIEAGGAEPAEVAAALDLLAESRWRGGKAPDPETRQIAERAIALRQGLGEPGQAQLAESLNNLAAIDFFVGRYREARSGWERALALRTQALGAKHPDTAQIMNNLGNLLLTIGAFDAALPLYEQSLAARREALGAEHPLVAQSLNNLAVLRAEMGDYAEALPLSEQALALYRKLLPPGHPKIATSLTAMARVLLETGEPERALASLEEGERIWEQALGPEHPSFALALNNRADELRKLGRLGEAEPLYSRALTILEKKYGPEHAELAGCLGGMGALAEARGEIPAAIALQRRVVAIKEKAFGGDHPRLALSLTDLGGLLGLQGDLPEATALLERAVSIRKAALGSEHPEVAASLNALAIVRTSAGAIGPATSAALEAEQIARAHLRLTVRSFSERQALRHAASRDGGLDLILALAAGGRLAGPERRMALDALVQSRAVVLDGMAARHRIAALTREPRIAQHARELAMGRARLAALTVRGLGDLDPARYRSMLAEAREEKEQAERALAAASSEFAADQERSRIGLAEVERSVPKGEVLVAVALYRDAGVVPDTTAPARVDVARAAARRRNPELNYVAFVLRAGATEPVVVDLGPAADLDRSIAAWKSEAAGAALERDVAGAESAYRVAGTDLRTRLWDPIARHLGSAGRVLVVPDGALCLVSLAALPAAGAGRYLIETGPPVHYLAAERDLVPPAGGVAGGTGILVVGAPDYDAAWPEAAAQPPIAAGSPPAGGIGQSARAAPGGAIPLVRRSACASFAAMRFEPLPATATEAEEVSRAWRGATGPAAKPTGDVLFLSGAQATEAAFKALASGRQILHLATHGFFLGGECAPSPRTGRGVGGVAPAAPVPPAGVAVTPPPAIGAPGSTLAFEDPGVGESPLLLSGFALAGANRRAEAGGAEDGILTAEEIVSLDLSGVGLAVLSACDTGAGEIRAGEGVMGLRRAMQVAGVRTLIMSLWAVDDEATREWMAALYDGLIARGLDTAAAVHGASVGRLAALRARGASTHPFYWGAFVAAGDWR